MGYAGTYSQGLIDWVQSENKKILSKLNNDPRPFPIQNFGCGDQDAPPFRERVENALTYLLHHDNILVLLTSGYRPEDLQDYLYNQYISGKSSFPAAAPGSSWHELGLAIDCVPIKPDGQTDYDFNNDIWLQLDWVFVVKYGLYNGAAFGDPVHYWNNSCLSLTDFKNIYYPKGYKPPGAIFAGLGNWFLLAALVGVAVSEDLKAKR